MTGVDQHLDLATPTTHQHHHIKQATETMSSSLISSQPSMSSMCDEIRGQDREPAQDQALDPTPGPHQGQCLEPHLSKDSTSRSQLFPNHQPIGSNKEAFHETTLNGRSPTISSSCDNRIRSLQPESKSPTWRFESPALHSAMMNTNNSRRIYNRWLNKEVLYTTMGDNSSSNIIRSRSTINSNISPTTHTEPVNSTTTTSSNSNNPSTCHQPPRAMSHNRSNTCPAITLASHNTSSLASISPSHDANHPKKKFTSSSRSTEANRDDSHPSKTTSRHTSSPKHPNGEHLQNESRHPDNSHPRRLHSSDSNLASSCMEERRQTLLKLHASSRVDSSRATAFKTPSKSRQVPKEPQSQQWHRRRPPATEESPPPLQPRAELNKKMAEVLWGKQLEADESRTLCRNSLPRRSLVSEARSKLRRSIDAELEDVEIEIQDILAQPLTADIVISSPSLFDDTSTSSSQSSSSPPVTVQLKVF